MGEMRNGPFPLAFPSTCLSPREEITLRTRTLTQHEIYRVEELYVPSRLVGAAAIQVFGFGVCFGEHADPTNRMLSKDPVLLDAFASYPIDPFNIDATQAIYIKLRNISHLEVDVSLAVRGKYMNMRSSHG